MKKKLNNKGMSIVEVLVTFSLIMVIVISMITIVMNYKSKVNTSYEKLELNTFKNTLTKDIQDDILAYGVAEINTGGQCLNRTDLEKCINIVFKNNTEKIFGVSRIDNNNKESVEKKYLYYDDLKYELKDELPTNIPESRNPSDFQTIEIISDSILSTDSVVLEDGKTIYVYKIDLYISHIDFEDDFGIHIVATTEDSLNKMVIEENRYFEINHEWSYNYVGYTETFIVPTSGVYEIRVTGGMGGAAYYSSIEGYNYDISADVRYPGYVIGEFRFKKDDVIYVTVGGGGGSARRCDEYVNRSDCETRGKAGWNGGVQGGYGISGSGGVSTVALADGLYSTIKDSPNLLISANGGIGTKCGWGNYHTQDLKSSGKTYINDTSLKYVQTIKKASKMTAGVPSSNVTFILKSYD